MRSITIHTDTGTSRVLVGERLRHLSQYLPGGRTILITDENILRLYGREFPEMPVIVTRPGENHKTMDELGRIFEKLIALEADRTTFITGIGGGIVCDVAGFAASVYMRGLRFGFVSTTLLSQVDASVGGKNGVNFNRYKNMIGVFSQPEFVICDTGMLRTLEKAEFVSGFAEVIKAAAIRDEGLFRYLEDNAVHALNMQEEVIEELVYRSVTIKADIVEQDEREKGERRKLNFGHTFAHTIEKLTGMRHGEAVAVGMVLATGLSEGMGLLAAEEGERIRKLIGAMGLPHSINLDHGEVLRTMKRDKKREGDDINLVLLDKIGHAVTRRISYTELEKLLYDLHQY